MEKAIFFDLLDVFNNTLMKGWVFHLIAVAYQIWLIIKSKRPATAIWWFPIAVVAGTRLAVLIFSLGIDDNWPKDLIPESWLVFYFPAGISELIITPLTMKLTGFRSLSIFPQNQDKKLQKAKRSA